MSEGATVLGIAATATGAIAGFRFSRSASDKALASACETNEATIEAARADAHATLQTTRDGQIANPDDKAIEQTGSEWPGHTRDDRAAGSHGLPRPVA